MFRQIWITVNELNKILNHIKIKAIILFKSVFSNRFRKIRSKFVRITLLYFKKLLKTKQDK